MYCEKTKDHLFNLIDTAETLDERIEIAHKIHIILEHTTGLWAECNYCYKAAEIIERAIGSIALFINQSETPIHWKRLETVQNLNCRLEQLQQRYKQLQTDVFNQNVTGTALYPIKQLVQS